MVPMRYLGDPVLRRKCDPIISITDEIRKIAEKLIITLKAHNGLGLAAPQIGYSVRMFAIQVSDEVDEQGNGYDTDPKIFINPKITSFSKETITLGEGCLSIPGFYEDVTRPLQIDVEATDIHGKCFTEKGLKRWRSRCVQHETDHIDGTLFIDRLTPELQKKHEAGLKLLEMQYRKRIITGDPFKI